ncbi:MAG: hypothetical protein IJ343_07890 [Clostridia bacterium]|nr:hypothetical protein [Clostridia bacterium]
MSVPAQNPVRLADARLACGSEWLLRSADGDFSWLPALAVALSDCAVRELHGEAAVILAITADPQGRPRTGLILRLRLNDPYASVQDCLAARARLLDEARKLPGSMPECDVPLAAEGLFARLPREGMRFLPRPVEAGGRPAVGNAPIRLDMEQLNVILLRHPDSGIALTLMPTHHTAAERSALEAAAAHSDEWRTLARDEHPLAFTLCVWGSAAPELTDLLNRAGLGFQLYRSAELPANDPLPGFESQFDPWALHERVRSLLNAHGLHSLLCRTSVQELNRLFGAEAASMPQEAELPGVQPGFCQPGLAPAPQPWACQPGLTPAVPAGQPEAVSFSADNETPQEIAASVSQLSRGLLDSLPDLTSQLLRSAGQLRADLQKQVVSHVSGQLGAVRQSLQGLSGQLMDMPGVQQTQVSSLLTRLQENLSLPELLDTVRQAGLDQPLDALSLMKMGFSSESELLQAGLPEDTLSLLRSTCALYAQRPAQCDESYNCMPHAIMLGYLYEALASSCLHPLFVRARIRRGNGLSAYDVVDWHRCEAFAACGDFRNPDMRRLTPADWAVWLNLMACCRMLRNRQHSDKGMPGFIDHAETDAFFSLMFFPGQSSKLAMLQLPCNGPCPPAWSKRFEPKIPADWADPPAADPYDCLQAHVLRHTAAFNLSLLRFMLSCGDLLPREETT